jgi:hypothetical protein
LIVRNPEHALDAGEVADTNLNVCPLVKARPGVDRPALDEDAPHRIKWREFSRLADLVKVIDYGAVQFAKYGILASFILRRVDVRLLAVSEEVLMNRCNRLGAGRGHKIEAETQFNDRAHDVGIGNFVGFALSPLCKKMSKLKAALWIGLPKLDPGA